MAPTNQDLLRILYPGVVPPAGPAPQLQTPPFDLGSQPGFQPPAIDVGALQSPTGINIPPPPPPAISDLLPQRPAPTPTPMPLQRPVARAAARGMAIPSLGQTLQMMGQASEEERAGIRAEAAAKAEGIRRETEGTTAANLAYREQIQKDQAIDQEARDQARAHMKDLYAEADQIANTKVDPNRLVANQSTLQKLLGAIAIGVGGYAGARTHTTNTAYEIMNKAIDDDIRAQVEDLSNRRAGLSAKNTLLQQQIALGRDDAEARHLTRVALWNLQINEAKNYAAATGSPEAMAKAQQLEAQAKGNLAKEAQTLYNQDHANRVADIHAQAAAAGVGLEQRKFELTKRIYEEAEPKRAAELEDIQAQAKERLAAAQAKAAGKGAGAGAEPTDPLTVLGATLPNGMPARHGEKTVVEKANIELAHHQDVIDATKRVEMARRIYDSMPASRENWERLKNAGGNLVKALRIQMAVKGLSSEVYKDIIDPIMADPTSLIHSDEIAWQSLREEQEREANNYLHHNINRNATWVPEPTKEEKDAQDFLQSQEEAAKESAKAQGKAMTGAIAPTRSTGRALPPPPPAESGLGVGPLTSPFMTPSMWMGR